MKELMEILEDLLPGIPLEGRTDLVESGDLDSMTILNLISDISDEFDVEILPTDVVPENFESVEAMWQLIMRLQED